MRGKWFKSVPKAVFITDGKRISMLVFKEGVLVEKSTEILSVAAKATTFYQIRVPAPENQPEPAGATA